MRGFHRGAAGSLGTYILHEKWASGVKHELVGIEHVPAVHLKLDITQVRVIDHGTEVSNQQTDGELKQESSHVPLSLASNCTSSETALGWPGGSLALLSTGFLP